MQAPLTLSGIGREEWQLFDKFTSNWLISPAIVDIFAYGFDEIFLCFISGFQDKIFLVVGGVLSNLAWLFFFFGISFRL